MKISPAFIAASMILPFSVHAQSIQDWEKCANRFGATINVLEIGNFNYEEEIKKHCGERPSSDITQDKLASYLASDVIQATQWKVKFQKLIKKDYAAVRSSLTVSATMQREGDWYVGSGYDPRGAGSEQAVIAVNIKSQQVLAAYISSGVLYLYGFDENSQNVPEQLWQWISVQTAAG